MGLNSARMVSLSDKIEQSKPIPTVIPIDTVLEPEVTTTTTGETVSEVESKVKKGRKLNK